eukprot:8821885-Pyramimonas_sp.AAC.1
MAHFERCRHETVRSAHGLGAPLHPCRQAAFPRAEGQRSPTWRFAPRLAWRLWHRPCAQWSRCWFFSAPCLAEEWRAVRLRGRAPD